MCDGKNDCGGFGPGWDEDPIQCANTTCADTEFKCSGGRCIPKLWRCDGEVDCRDKSDENGCTNQNKTCAPSMFTCTNGKGKLVADRLNFECVCVCVGGRSFECVCKCVCGGGGVLGWKF